MTWGQACVAVGQRRGKLLSLAGHCSGARGGLGRVGREGGAAGGFGPFVPHLADSCPPEAGKVAEVLTGPGLCLTSLNQSRPQARDAQQGTCHPITPSLFSTPQASGRAQAWLWLGPLL